MKISLKLNLLFGSIAIMLIIINQGFLLIQGSKIVEDLTYDNLQSITTTKLDQLNSKIEVEAKKIESIAEEKIFMDYFIAMLEEHHRYFFVEENGTKNFNKSEITKVIMEEEKESSSTHTEFHHVLKDKVAKEESLIRLWVIEPDGHIHLSTKDVVSEEDISYENYFKEGMKNTYVSPIYYDEESVSSVFIISTPIKKIEGREVLGVIGVLAAEVKIDLNDLLFIKDSKHKTKESYVINKEGIMLSKSIFNVNEEFNQVVDTKATRECLNGNTGYGEYKDYRGVKVLGIYIWLPEFDACLLTEIDREEAFIEVNSLSVLSMVTALLFSLIIVLISILIARQITGPLVKLNKVAKEIGEGNLDVDLNIKSKDELGDLAISVMQMVKDLKSARRKIDNYGKDLEREIENKTKQLKGKLIDLEENKKATLNMMEDLDEVNKGLRETQDNLKWHVKELKKLDKQKDQFILIAAHELKTPLTSIKGFANLLLNDKVAKNPKLRKNYLQIISNDTKRLSTLITNVLEISRIDLGTLKVSKENFSVKDIMDEVQEQMGIVIKNNGLDPKFSIDENLPKINVDKDKIVQVLSNLINNAVHYTEQGSIYVKAAKNKRSILFSVTDTGTGIPKKLLKKVFNRFYQVDSPMTRKIGGTGLGLALCQGFVAAMGGKIWVESEVGKGSTFYFTIPITEEKEEDNKKTDKKEDKDIKILK